MFAIPTAEYVALARDDGRGIVQYALALPADAKRRLRKLLDAKTAERLRLPFDILKRGCAQTVLAVLREALSPHAMTVWPWPGKFERMSRSELFDAAMEGSPWRRFFFYAMCGATTDDGMDKFRKVVVPGDLVEILRIARIGSRHVIEGEGEELLPAGRAGRRPGRHSRVTPFAASWAVFALAAVFLVSRRRWIERAFFAAQLLFGLFLLPAALFAKTAVSGWNWLVVPFNVLPFVFWEWREKWALWFAGLLAAWCALMILHPHRLVDPAYLVLAGAYALVYVRVGLDEPRVRAAIDRWCDRQIPAFVKKLGEGCTY